MTALEETMNDSLRICSNAAIQLSSDQGPTLLPFHWTLVAASGDQLRISFDRTPTGPWDFGDLIFQSAFEAGDLREWNTAPP